MGIISRNTTITAEETPSQDIHLSIRRRCIVGNVARESVDFHGDRRGDSTRVVEKSLVTYPVSQLAGKLVIGKVKHRKLVMH